MLNPPKRYSKDNQSCIFNNQSRIFNNQSCSKNNRYDNPMLS